MNKQELTFSSLIKIGPQTILEINEYELKHLQNIELQEQWGRWVGIVDFEKSINCIFNILSPHMDDVMLWELKKLVDESIQKRKKELIECGVDDYRTK